MRYFRKSKSVYLILIANTNSSNFIPDYESLLNLENLLGLKRNHIVYSDWNGHAWNRKEWLSCIYNTKSIEAKSWRTYLNINLELWCCCIWGTKIHSVRWYNQILIKAFHFDFVNKIFWTPILRIFFKFHISIDLNSSSATRSFRCYFCSYDNL